VCCSVTEGFELFTFCFSEAMVLMASMGFWGMLVMGALVRSCLMECVHIQIEVLSCAMDLRRSETEAD